MRAFKILGIAVGVLVALVVLLLLGVWLFVNPNNYKGRIATAVKQSTGRELELPGDIKLSVFPWVALELGPARLGNPPGFGAEPFAALQHAALRVRLLPLLRKQLRIGRIELDGLDLRLRKNSAGQGNWQGFGGSSPSKPSSSGSSSATLEDIGGIKVKDSRISYEKMVVEHLNVDIGHVGSGAAVPVSLRLDITTSPGAKPITFAFSAPDLSLDLAAQTLSAPSFSGELAAARLSGTLRGAQILDAPHLTGSFKLAPVALRELMGQLDMKPPETRDPKALARFDASGEFSYGGNAAAASKLAIQLDDSTLSGNVAVTNLDTDATHFDLNLDRIDLDRYRSPVASHPQAAQKPPESAAAKRAEPEKEPSKSAQMDGTFTIGSAVVAGLHVSQVSLHMTAKNGITHIAPAKAKLYGGDYSGEITLDDSGAVPTMKLDQSMTQVDVAQLLNDLAKTQRITGRGNVTTNLTARGQEADDILKTLNGHVTANLADGAVQGIDLWFEINRAIALIQKQAFPTGSGTGRTKFDAFKATADITNGVAATKDLSIISQNLRIAGQGTVNLVNDALNYQVKATILKNAPTAKAAPSETLADVPLNITGTLSSPEVRPDLNSLAKAAVQQQLDKHKDELRQKLQDKLKDLLK